MNWIAIIQAWIVLYASVISIASLADSNDNTIRNMLPKANGWSIFAIIVNIMTIAFSAIVFWELMRPWIQN